MGLLKRRIIESEEPKEEPPMVNTVDMDIVESLRYVAQSAKPVDAGQMRAAADEIERLRAERQWIPVEERLPEDGIKVLVCFKGEIDSIEIREFLGGLGGVTHWMPLPEPPEVK